MMDNLQNRKDADIEEERILARDTAALAYAGGSPFMCIASSFPLLIGLSKLQREQTRRSRPCRRSSWRWHATPKFSERRARSLMLSSGRTGFLPSRIATPSRTSRRSRRSPCAGSQSFPSAYRTARLRTTSIMDISSRRARLSSRTCGVYLRDRCAVVSGVLTCMCASHL